MTEPDWAVVVNPTKFADPATVRAEVERYCTDHGHRTPRWYETTAEDPGEGQARAALAAGATVVCPLGGDGTVRAVAGGLVGSGVPLGLLPSGTGNLLARNLRLPIDDLAAALTVALTGSDVPIDVGEVRFDSAEPQVFLVMCGIGLDGQIMAEVDEGLKKRVGWLAYVASGARAVFRLGFSVRVRVGAERLVSQHARTVLVANCGELTGGLRLVPDARVDDGLLDVVVASPRSLSGWLAIGLNVLSARRRGHRALAITQDSEAWVLTREPIEAQLDGDAVGPRTELRCRVRPGELLVRLPRGRESSHFGIN